MTDTLAEVNEAMFNALRSHPRGTLKIAGPVEAIAWETGRASRDALLAESRNNGDQYERGVWYDRGLWDYDSIQRERAGEGVRLIISHWSSIVDHILPECPAVRRAKATASYAVGIDDPHGTDVCGWCYRVWAARQAKAAA